MKDNHSDNVGTAGKDKPKDDTVTILVNRKEVTVPDKKVTGLQIKQAAIAAGLQNVTVDFDLFRVTGDAQHRVPNEDEITVHGKQQFRMLTPDHAS